MLLFYVLLTKNKLEEYAMKKFRLESIAYKLGRLSTKSPKLSLKPIKNAYKAFKAGRDDAKIKVTIH